MHRILISQHPNKAYIYSLVLLRFALHNFPRLSLFDSVNRRSKSPMDRAQLILLGLPIFLFCSDLFNLFTPPPPKPQHHRPHQPPHIPHQHRPAMVIPETLDFPSQVNFSSCISLSIPSLLPLAYLPCTFLYFAEAKWVRINWIWKHRRDQLLRLLFLQVIRISLL